MSSIPTSKVNMSLDDIIKQSRKEGKNRNRSGGRRNFGERRRYSDKPRGEMKNRNGQEEIVEKRTRLFVSNLQKEIVNSELRVCY